MGYFRCIEIEAFKKLIGNDCISVNYFNGLDTKKRDALLENKKFVSYEDIKVKKLRAK